ncbi:hypothetical protein [Nocardia arthritidis]|uniref:Uncharacterized protein n=1 Tax=Nocardia arthritidis TaxID=228602 RepID=A0A6G9YSN9_9NOCA|nr:hypothetical protein [Nocardia arthritidis]QIS16329.1 hypothetical protein F5544_42605 [Nocardia arthritidis]
MEALAALLLIALFIYLTRPLRGTGYRLERYRPDPAGLSYYEEQRRYSELVAIYGRNDASDTETLPGSARPVADTSAETGAAKVNPTWPRRPTSDTPARRTTSACPRRPNPLAAG